MKLFLLTFFLLYSLLHLYAFVKIKLALSFNTKFKVFLIAFMVVMILSPLFIYYFEKLGIELFAMFMSYTGYIWMAILFLFVSASFCIDIYRISIYLISSVLYRKLRVIIPSAKLTFYISILFALTVSIYGYFEAKDIHIEQVIIKTSKIPKEINKIKIAQISDVHLGLIVREKRLRKIIEKVKKINPDIMVSTGDLVDGQINRLEGLAEILQEIKPRYGKFAITGNHEFYAGLEQSLSFTKKAGFSILRGNSVVAGAINIAGVDDRAGKPYELLIDIPEKELLSQLDKKKFTLLLKHRPLIDKEAIGLFDLQLSGHTHKGQIFPFSLLTHLYYPQNAGYKNLYQNSHLYVSRGSGTWGPPIRFLSPPEVTMIDLVHEQRIKDKMTD